MKIKPTLLNNQPTYSFKPPVLFVGFNDSKKRSWLDTAVSFAGYKEAILFPYASSAKRYLQKNSDEQPLSRCIVNARYDYSEQFDKSIPRDELPFCTLEGLSYYQRRKRPIDGFFQGLQFVRQVAKNYPQINFAIYGPSCYGIPTQAKELKIDFIPELSAYIHIPFSIVEYLRNKNTDLFEK